MRLYDAPDRQLDGDRGPPTDRSELILHYPLLERIDTIEDTTDNMPTRSHSVGFSLSRGLWTRASFHPDGEKLRFLEETSEPLECGRPWSTGNFAGSKEWGPSQVFTGVIRHLVGQDFDTSRRSREITCEEMTRVKMKPSPDLGDFVRNVGGTGKDSCRRL
jgi:hypothetical protein